MVLSHISVSSNFQLQVQMNEIQTQSSTVSTEYLKGFTKNQRYQNMQCRMRACTLWLFYLKHVTDLKYAMHYIFYIINLSLIWSEAYFNRAWHIIK